MKKKITALLIVSLLLLPLFGCGTDEDDTTVVGIWQSPPVAGHDEGFIYELTEDGFILASFGGFLYVGGTYEVKNDRITLTDYPNYYVESVNNRRVIVINYSNTTEFRFEYTGTELHLTGADGTAIWTRATSVVPTPTPTPTPMPTPEATPTPIPEVTKVTVLYDGVPLPFVTEFSQRAGEEHKDNKFSVEVRPDGIEAEVTIESSNEEIFTVEKINIGGLPNGFEVTGVSPGVATLTVAAGDIVERITVRITEE